MNVLFIRYVLPATVLLLLIGGGIAVTQHTKEELKQEAGVQADLDTTKEEYVPTPREKPVFNMFSIVPVGTGTGRPDLTVLALGDQKFSTTTPLKGSIYSCRSNFDGNSASDDGEWLNEASSTYNVTIKPNVDGSNDWPSASVVFKIEGDSRIVQTNGLPTTHGTGDFPVDPDDDAYEYDRNPNTVTEQLVSYTFPSNPVEAETVSCVSKGTIGIALNGVAIFNGFDSLARDAVAYEIQDICGGHPNSAGEYHYHSGSSCFDDIVDEKGHSQLFGYVLDGFGLYGKQSGGEYVNNDDLDVCHGHIHSITWDGSETKMYHYHVTDEYPYTIGCYTGEVETGGGSLSHTDTPTEDSTQPNPLEDTPPQEAIDACNDKEAGSVCSMQTLQGDKGGTCLTPPNSSTLVCILI